MKKTIFWPADKLKVTHSQVNVSLLSSHGHLLMSEKHKISLGQLKTMKITCVLSSNQLMYSKTGRLTHPSLRYNLNNINSSILH